MSGIDENPAFPQPEDAEVKLWRYLDLDKFEWLLENKRLFMPVTEELGDPLEGTRPAGDKKWWDEQAEKAEDNEKRDIINSNSIKISTFANSFRKNYFVSCWHMNSDENDKMWEYYTKTSESVAISTTYSNFRSVLPNYIYSGVVRYIDYTSEKLPTFNLFEYIMHKNIDYSFEKEVRAVAAALTAMHWENENFKGNIFQLDSNPEVIFHAPVIEVATLIQGVTLHPDTTHEISKKISGLCKEHDLPEPNESGL